MISSEQLTSLNEAELREQFLIPLFVAMGYKNVDHYHGGTQEQGKDIVMWKADDFGERVNYGVVVKAGKVRGTASGKGSAAEVYFQIKQCLGDPFTDSVTLEERRVHQCIVVSSKVISKEPRRSLLSSLSRDRVESNVRFIHGRHLLDLVNEHLPEYGITSQVASVAKDLKSLSPNYNVFFKNDSEGTKYWLEPKHDKAESLEPLKFEFGLKIPNTPEGDELKKAILSHTRTGAPVRIEQKFISSFQSPDFLQPLLDPSGDGPAEIFLGPTDSPTIVPVKVEVQSGEAITLYDQTVELKLIQSGSEEFTLSNEHQASPLDFTLVVNRIRDKISISISGQLRGYNIKSVDRAISLLNALQNKSILRFISVESDLELFSGPIEEGFLSPIPDSWISLTKKLLFIQEQTNRPIMIPDRDLTEEEFDIIEMVSDILKSGKVEYGIKEFTIPMYRETAINTLEAFEGVKPRAMMLTGYDSEIVLGTEIDLGRVIKVIESVHISKSARRKIKRLIQSEFSEPIEVDFTYTDESRFVFKYLDWMSEEDLKEVPEHILQGFEELKSLGE